MPSLVLRVERAAEVGGWNVFVGKQRPFSMAGTGRIAGAAQRRREVRNKEATVDIREAGIFNAGRRALPRRGEA